MSANDHRHSVPLSSSQRKAVAHCEEELGYEFKEKRFLVEALTHASVASTRLNSYERMEFLGDSILGFVVCEYLFRAYPEWLEGELTQVKSNVVSRQSCARIGKELRLDQWLVVGKGLAAGGEVPESLLGNAFESVVAAVYLDGGIQVANAFLLPLIIPRVHAAVEGGVDVNYKSELQQYSQKRYGVPPIYKLVDHRGPDHDKWFLVAAQIAKKPFGPAWGKNKKEAEQKAAANALAMIDGQEAPHSEFERE